MKTSVEYSHKTIRPDDDNVFTVRDLIEILSHCPPNAEIVVGTGLNDCEEYVERVIVSASNILFATEPNEPDNRNDGDQPMQYWLSYAFQSDVPTDLHIVKGNRIETVYLEADLDVAGDGNDNEEIERNFISALNDYIYDRGRPDGYFDDLFRDDVDDPSSYLPDDWTPPADWKKFVPEN